MPPPGEETTEAASKRAARPSRALLLYGTEEPVPPPCLLRAGPLSAVFGSGNLRYVRFRGEEVIRAISFLVRDRAWATCIPALRDLRVNEREDAFEVTYSATVEDRGARLAYTARIAGRGADGTLVFEAEARAETEFVTCRTGFVVLHPLEGVAGRPAEIEHVDGRRVRGAFPRLIDPLQPMLDLRQLTHETPGGVRVTCRMEGDAFETEDQRNWSDASFKTYVRPLSKPWPFTLRAGETLRQSVTLTCEAGLGAPAVSAGAATEAIRVTLGPEIGPMPAVALGCTPAEAEDALRQPQVLPASGVRRLVCRFDPGQGHGAAALEAYRRLAEEAGVAIELQLVVTAPGGFEAEIEAAADMVREVGLELVALMVSPAADLKSTTPGQPWPPCPTLDALYRAARRAFPGVVLGGGMFSYFTELNRKPPPCELLDFITFSTCPIVHAGDDRSVMESLEAVPYLAESAHAIAGDLPYVVGPSAIGMRDNPYGPTALPNPQSIRQAMSGPDPRQAGLLGAAWTLGYVARFAAGGARRLAISAPVGPFGIAADSGLVHPVFHVVRGLASLEGGALRAVSTSAEREALALCAGSTALWLANLTPEPRTVEVPPEFLGADLRMLDAAWLSGVAALMMRAAGRNSASRVPAAVAGLRGCIPGTWQAPL
jgi:D-apionolactonase